MDADAGAGQGAEAQVDAQVDAGAEAGTHTETRAPSHADARAGVARARADRAARAGRVVRAAGRPQDPFIRAENEDDDGYDPYSDRRPEREPLFERDPWA